MINLHIPQTQNRSQFLVTTVYNTTLTAEDTQIKSIGKRLWHLPIQNKYWAVNTFPLWIWKSCHFPIFFGCLILKALGLHLEQWLADLPVYWMAAKLFSPCEPWTHVQEDDPRHQILWFYTFFSEAERLLPLGIYCRLSSFLDLFFSDGIIPFHCCKHQSCWHGWKYM